MTLSRRHKLIIGITTAESEKRDKILAHRAQRSAVRIALATGEDAPSSKAFDDPCTTSKDGKQWLSDPKPELLRK